MARLSEPSPYVEFDRSQWRELRKSTPQPLTEEELVGLRGLGEQIDLDEVAEVYLPLARLIHLQVAARQRLFAATASSSASHPPRPAGAVRHRRRGQRGGGQVDHGARAAGAAGPLGPPPARGPGDHRRLLYPNAELGAGEI